VIDTLRPVTLPEGAEITLRLAGPVARARAWLIDASLRFIVLVSVPPLLMPLGKAGFGLFLVLFFALTVLYPVFFEALWNGATPGKRICNLAVVHADGTPVGWPAAFLRNVVRLADALPVGYAVGLASMLLDRQFRRLGDLAAGTVVIHRDVVGVPVRGRAEAPPITPAVALTPLEQRAVVDFADRRRGWSDERAAELAQIAQPLVGRETGADAVATLEGVAAHLVARR
jgi:uncharacterized RDD family membrane protein YckC